MKRYSVLILTLMVASCAAAAPTSVSKPEIPTRLPVLKPTTTGQSSGIFGPGTFISPVASEQGTGDTYYVATNGSDNDPGTEARPFRTIAKGVSILGAGDTLYIREGTYHEEIVVSASGTADGPITLSAYPGEHPIIDAENVLPVSPEESLFILKGDHIVLSGLEIRNVRGLAVQVEGSYTTVRNMKTHHSLKEGIYVGRGGTVCSDGINATNNTVEDNEIWMSSLMHEGVTTGHGWSGGISVGRCPQYTMVRRNVVHETWGIGIQVYEAYNTTIEDNVVWNNQMEHYYVNNAPYTLVQRNLSYNTPDSTFLYQGAVGVGIAFCDERPQPVSHHVAIINNLVWRGGRGFMFFSQQPGTGLKSFLIANNTFVDSREAGLEIRPGDHENSRIQNNIIFGQDTAASVLNDPGLNFSHNLWSKAPPAAASGDGDVIGDPRLAMSGSTGPGLLKPDWFKLLPDSPAIDAGISLSQVPDDFDRVSRPRGAAYDIGAYESLYSARIADLRVVSAVGDTPSLTITLRWTAPADAAAYALRRSETLLTEANWDSASVVPVPFKPSAPGSAEDLTATVSYNGRAVYLAFRSQNNEGTWSELSNNVAWPLLPSAYLSLTATSGGSSSRIIGPTPRPRASGSIPKGYTDMIKRYVYSGIALVAIIGLVFIALFGRRAWNWLQERLARPLPVSTERIENDGAFRNVILLHHSTGRNLIGQGNVRALFNQKGYQFWDHDYNTIGLTRPDGTRTHTSYNIPEVLPGVTGGGNTNPRGLAILFAQPAHDPPDNAFSRLLQHQVLIFKSCFPNSAIKNEEGLEQHKTSYLEMRSVMDQHPDHVFVLLTTLPLHPEETNPEEADRARALAQWLQSDEFLKGHPNLFVFDFYGLLADPATNMLRSEYQLNPNSPDSHPNALANQTIGPLLIDFVDRAVQTYRLSTHETGTRPDNLPDMEQAEMDEVAENVAPAAGAEWQVPQVNRR